MNVKRTMQDYADSIDANNDERDDVKEFRNCPFCGGEAKAYMMRNGKYGSSAFVACTKCNAKSNPVWLGTHGEDGMFQELRSMWNKTIYDNEIRGLKKTKNRLQTRISDLGLTEAQCMKRSYRKFKGEDWQ